MTIETWTYLGERPGATAAKVAAWRRETTELGELIAFKATANTRGRVGYQYAINFDEVKGTANFVSKEFLNVRAEDAPNIELENENEAYKLSKAALERNAPRRKEINEALAPLVKLAFGLGVPARSALIQYVERTIWSA